MRVGPYLLGACALVVLIAGCTSNTPTAVSPSSGNTGTRAILPRAGAAPSFVDGAVRGCHHGPGRPGDTISLVPSHPTTLTICSRGSGDDAKSRPTHTRNRLVAGQFDQVLVALREGTPESPAIGVCDAGGMARTYTLDFGYRTGPDVSIDIGPDCHPSITNGHVKTDNWQDVMNAVDQLIGVRCSNLIC